MTNFIKPEYLVSLYLILNDKEEVTLRELGDYVGKLNEELRERKVEAVFLFSNKYIDEMLFDYEDYFEYNGLCDEVTHQCTHWVKRKVSNEVLSEKFTAYLSNDVAKVVCDLRQKERYMSSTEKMIEVMKACTEGKPIQSKTVTGEHWCDIPEPTWDWRLFEYRVKPEKEEPAYRQYENTKEMLEDINERRVAIQHPVFPGVWLKNKEYDIVVAIAGLDNFDTDKPEILLGENWTTLTTAFNNFTYLDGTPFGMKE